jgi:hypothetical protein
MCKADGRKQRGVHHPYMSTVIHARLREDRGRVARLQRKIYSTPP